MLSDKEKKAIELLEDHLICGNKEGVLYINLRIILRIIEKQSKEIEELKKKPMFLIKDIYSPKLKEISLQDVEGLIEQGREEVKNKIKAKIEEYRHKDFIKMQVVMKHDKEALEIAEVLQSLLEKEFPTTITKEELEKRWKE